MNRLIVNASWVCWCGETKSPQFETCYKHRKKSKPQLTKSKDSKKYGRGNSMSWVE